ncbi:NADH:ubiquinone oxidoreductase [Serendipita sp. 399]|nr:NADH:ubiquinone oxidoreductase [Serendipita sp. 399]
MAWKDRHPGDQIPHDPSKKTIIVLGSGWAAISMLKSLDTQEYNVIVVSPRNYFLFTPLLPSVPVGTTNPRSIIQPIRYITRHKARRVLCYEGEALAVDPEARTVTFQDTSPIRGEGGPSTISYDYLIYAVGAETQTFGIPGAKENSCFLKELWDAEQLRSKTMDCIESAAFPGQSDSEVDRLLHMVVVGGGPTGVELAGELHDFAVDDLMRWYPELAQRVKITLIEALPNVLPMFSKQLIAYTESTFKQNKIDILTKTMVKEIKPKSVVVKDPSGATVEIPFGLLVWAGGNTLRPITKDLIAKLGEHQTNKRGLTVDDHMAVVGSNGTIYAFGDCTATSYAPTAQVAAQQGTYVGRLFNQMAEKEKLEASVEDLKRSKAELNEIDAASKKLLKASKFKPFHYSHQGSLAYIGSDKAIADLPFLNGNLDGTAPGPTEVGALDVFYGSIIVENESFIPTNGTPCIICSNHTNSLTDAMHRERFRSDVLVSFNPPLKLRPKDYPQLIQPVEFPVIRSLTAFMQSQISSGTIDAPDWKTVRVAKLAARMYAPLGTRMTLGDHVRVTRVFSDAFSGITSRKWEDSIKDESGWGDPTTAGKGVSSDDPQSSTVASEESRERLAEDLAEYQDFLTRLGIKDERIRRALPRAFLFYRILIRVVWMFFLLTISIPGLLLWLPIYLTTSYAVWRFKMSGPIWDTFDEIAQYKMVYGLAAGVTVYGLCLLVTWPVTAITFWAVPLLMWLTLRWWEDAISAARALNALLRLFLLGRHELGRTKVWRDRLHKRVMELAQQLELPEDPEAYFSRRGGKEKGRVRGSWESGSRYFSLKRRRKRDWNEALRWYDVTDYPNTDN